MLLLDTLPLPRVLVFAVEEEEMAFALELVSLQLKLPPVTLEGELVTGGSTIIYPLSRSLLRVATNSFSIIWATSVSSISFMVINSLAKVTMSLVMVPVVVEQVATELDVEVDVVEVTTATDAGEVEEGEEEEVTLKLEEEKVETAPCVGVGGEYINFSRITKLSTAMVI